MDPDFEIGIQSNTTIFFFGGGYIGTSSQQVIHFHIRCKISHLTRT